MVKELITCRVFVHIIGLKVLAAALLCLSVAIHCVVGPLGLLLEMHSKSRLVIDVVTTPKVHGNAPEDGELCKATPYVRHIPEKL